jgi:hypothetical protein
MTMHDLDRTLQALEPEGEYGAGEYELSPEVFGSGEVPLSPAAEMELASELAAVTNETELEQFLHHFHRRYPRMRRRGRQRLRRFFRRYVDDDAPPPPPPTIVEAPPDADDDDGGESELDGARRCVRLAAAAARKMAEGAQEVAPAPATPSVPSSSTALGRAAGSPRPAGRWVRHGRTIVLHGV